MKIMLSAVVVISALRIKTAQNSISWVIFFLSKGLDMLQDVLKMTLLGTGIPPDKAFFFN